MPRNTTTKRRKAVKAQTVAVPVKTLRQVQGILAEAIASSANLRKILRDLRISIERRRHPQF